MKKEKNIIQRENYLKNKEEKIKYNNIDIKEKNKYRNNAGLFIKTEELISKD